MSGRKGKGEEKEDENRRKKNGSELNRTELN